MNAKTAQAASQTKTTTSKLPVQTFRLGRIKAAVWETEADQKKFYNVTFARTYMDEARTFHDTDSFGRDDLPLVAKLADQADLSDLDAIIDAAFDDLFEIAYDSAQLALASVGAKTDDDLLDQVNQRAVAYAKARGAEGDHDENGRPAARSDQGGDGCYRIGVKTHRRYPLILFAKPVPIPLSYLVTSNSFNVAPS